MSWEIYGPPERDAQGQRLMERELTADAWREHKMRGRDGGKEAGMEGRRENRKGGWGGGTGRVIEREGEERDDEGWSTAGSGETNGPAWRDSSQSIIFKQKQQAQENI